MEPARSDGAWVKRRIQACVKRLWAITRRPWRSSASTVHAAGQVTAKRRPRRRGPRRSDPRAAIVGAAVLCGVAGAVVLGAAAPLFGAAAPVGGVAPAGAAWGPGSAGPQSGSRPPGTMSWASQPSQLSGTTDRPDPDRRGSAHAILVPSGRNSAPHLVAAVALNAHAIGPVRGRARPRCRRSSWLYAACSPPGSPPERSAASRWLSRASSPAPISWPPAGSSNVSRSRNQPVKWLWSAPISPLAACGVRPFSRSQTNTWLRVGQPGRLLPENGIAKLGAVHGALIDDRGPGGCSRCRGHSHTSRP